MTQSYSKKFPLNLAMHDENLMVSNPRIVDVEWETIHMLGSKNLNKVLMPRFLITLTVLAAGDFRGKGGVVETVQWSSKRNELRLKKVAFECEYEELTHLVTKLKNGCNSVETLMKSGTQQGKK
mmetsp:Transcript_20818/g.14935  ORF Transcript_20818/g.14935 Transcript_20818/m.14935 type:complete len:124 (+) Transcript_20818:432-803(+)